MSAPLADFLTGLARHSAAAGVLVVLILCVQRLLGNRLAPRWHCALWLLVIARLLPFSISSALSIFNVLPTSPFAPSAAVAFLHGAGPAPEARPSPTLDPTAAIGVTPPGLGSENAAPTTWLKTWDLSTLLFCVWLGGAIALSAYVLASSCSLAHRLRRLRPVEDPTALAVLRDSCTRMGVRRAPRLIESTHVASPALHGLFRARLLLPHGFIGAFSTEELRFVFLHELAHLRRRDLWLNWVVTALQIVHWFNPLVWLGLARWRVDREIACDAMALAAVGPTQNREYGRTILRLLETFAAHAPRPGLVGILEDRRQLRRRMRMIANYSPARPRPAAMAVIALLAIVGLTDAQVTPSPGPAAPPVAASEDAPTPENTPARSGPYVLFLVNGSETMLGETTEEIAVRRAQNDEQKRTAPKWQRTAETLRRAITALAPDTAYHVVVSRDDRVLSLGWGAWNGSSGTAEAEAIVQRLRQQTPRRDFDLEAAFGASRPLPDGSPPECIVLITDGLPTSSQRLRNDGSITEAQRASFFEQAIKSLPPRIPVQTFLLPLLPGDAAATGLYWGLAHATQGGLICPAPSQRAAPTHLAFVIDTSGSMRDPKTGGLWPIVLETVETMLNTPPLLVGVQFLDGDGRFILGRRGNGASAWLPNTPETRNAILQTLRGYNQDTVSNPVPGVYNAVRFLFDKGTADLHMGITVLGDEFNSTTSADAVVQRLDKLNPPDASGQRPIIISAIGFPTTARFHSTMGNTGVRFASLMRTITYQHGGGFIGLNSH